MFGGFKEAVIVNKHNRSEAPRGVSSIWCVSLRKEQRGCPGTQSGFCVCSKAARLLRGKPMGAEKGDQIYSSQLLPVFPCFNIWPDFQQNSTQSFHSTKHLHTPISHSHRSSVKSSSPLFIFWLKKSNLGFKNRGEIINEHIQWRGVTWVAEKADDV